MKVSAGLGAAGCISSAILDMDYAWDNSWGAHRYWGGGTEIKLAENPIRIRLKEES